jgi:hypothetical protein
VSVTAGRDLLLKLRLPQASRDTGQVGRLPAPSYLPRVNVYLPKIRSKLGSKQVLISGRWTFTRGK